MATQLYAKIKKSSKYYYQNELAKKQGQCPFPVEVALDYDSGTGYVIKGGPGGQYEVRDVNLYAIVDGRDGGVVEIKLS
ncbi:hypothetical protein LXM94_25610 [Rhizobium sp. TRM95111]|uniref:hypothetical protein n=1 Tax=Rhizobium alarense TaxID=2846851 RepID=UPI001F2CEEEE|nr:hypothetical protein [Rhizobium alarense]MCF3643334.1 hypothetical protein [Rhizobium alarense]